MKSAILISLAFHVVAIALSMITVKFRQVRYIPREVYTVQIVEQPRPQPIVPQPEPEPPTPEPAAQPEPDDPEPEEILPPPDKPKPPKPNKKVKQTVQREKIEPPKPTVPQADAGEAPQPETGDMQLSSEDFPFQYYLSQMRRKVASNWRVPGTGKDELHCIVAFRVTRGGTVEGIAVETGSGNLLFDQAALRAVTQANPLPPLPGGFQDDYLDVHYTFAYEKEY